MKFKGVNHHYCHCSCTMLSKTMAGHTIGENWIKSLLQSYKTEQFEWIGIKVDKVWSAQKERYIFSNLGGKEFKRLNCLDQLSKCSIYRRNDN